MPDPGLLDGWPQGAPAACQPGLQRGVRGVSPRPKKGIPDASLPHSGDGPSLLERRTPLVRKADPPYPKGGPSSLDSLPLPSPSMPALSSAPPLVFSSLFLLSLSRSWPLSRQWILLLFPSLFRSGREVFAFGILSSSAITTQNSTGCADPYLQAHGSVFANTDQYFLFRLCTKF